MLAQTELVITCRETSLLAWFPAEPAVEKWLLIVEYKYCIHNINIAPLIYLLSLILPYPEATAQVPAY